MSLYPNFPEAFREAMKYFDFSKDVEERKKQEENMRKLESEMNGLNSKMDYAVGPVLGMLDDRIKSSGLEVSSEKIKEIKRKVLENMKKYV